jgi:hypothetical protein
MFIAYTIPSVGSAEDVKALFYMCFAEGGEGGKEPPDKRSNFDSVSFGQY